MKFILKYILLVLFLPCSLTSQEKNVYQNNFPDPKFELLTVNEGLPENSVSCFLQDRFGYLWMGTRSGLVKYNGYSMKVFYNDAKDSTSIDNHRTNLIFEDGSGTLWIGTLSGLNRFNRKTETFSHYISGDVILSMFEDLNGNLWAIGEKRIYLFDKTNNRFNLHQIQDTAYTSDVYKYFLSLKEKGRLAASILNVKDNANKTTSFSLKQKSPVYIVIVGESTLDYGWLENDRGKVIYSHDMKSTYYAGGRIDNRIQIIKTTLSAGNYMLRYKSDGSHSYNTWTDPPTYPEFWGIQIFLADGSQEDFKKEIVDCSTMGFSTALFDSSAGVAFVGSWFGLYIFNPTQNKLEVLYSINIPGAVQKIFKAKNGNLWIGHDNGLISYNPVTKTSMILNEIHSPVITIEQDQNGFIWCYSESATRKNELLILNPETGIIKKLGNNLIKSIYKDNSGIMWLGTGWEGLKKWDKTKNKFSIYKYNPKDKNTLSSNLVNSVGVDSDEILWVGTDKGLDKFDREKGVIKHYPFPDDQVTVVHINNSGYIWLGTRNSGLVRFDPIKGTFHYYSHNPYDTGSISSNHIFGILTDLYGNIWVGTRRNGLNLLNIKSGKFKHYKANPDGNVFLNDNLLRHYKANSDGSDFLSDNTIMSMYEDPDGVLWIATNLGLNRYNRLKDNFTFQLFAEAEILGGTNIVTSSSYQDKKGNFWIANFFTGLHLFDKEKLSAIKNFTENDGLATNTLANITEDGNGSLWIKTLKGLSRFNPETEIFRNYDYSYGLPADMTGPFFAYQSYSGEVFIPTYEGLVYFHPDSIKDDPIPPKVVISNLSLFNKEDEILEYDGFISDIKEIPLLYNQNDLRFDFTALHFGEPLKNRYKYMLENFDEDWIDAGTQRNATYTNLNPGEYTFKVIACNRDGVWNEEGASLKLIISPPFWATWWAYSLYIIFFGSILYGARRYEMSRVNWKNQVKLDEVKLKEKEETDRMKSRFFANISHEFRTPLTLILGPAEKINPELPAEEINKQASLIKRNASQLLGLVNQLLDLSKLEAGKLELQASKGNIVSFVKGIAMSFESLAERKNIQLHFFSEKGEIDLYFDRDKLAKILTNILSNAFKFTGEGGEIEVSVRHAEFISASSVHNEIPKQVRNDNMVTISVKDSGIGISEEELTKLFDRFYQVDSSQTREHEGTGIGLALTKELVELHKGTIKVKSKVNEGSEFIVELPIGKEHLSDDEIVEAKEDESIVILKETKNLTEVIAENIARDSSSKIPQNDNETGEDKTIILIVEDNADVSKYIKDSLGDNFQIEEAANGELGVEKAKEIIPDLIISDIMMPRMDGNELTRRIKKDERTSHIPVILLTAKSERESKLEGLETGADDYLTKPFDTKELQIRIKNLINIRKKLQEKYSKGDFEWRKDKKKLSSLDEKFMNKVNEIIVKHLSEEEFSIEEFNDEVEMSKTQIYRKLKALTGKSPSRFIRSVRLSKARFLIKEKAGTISEIAYSVGFSSPQYFTRCFKEEFGYPPGDLVK